MKKTMLVFSFAAVSLSAQQLAVRSADGSWYSANPLSATVEKRSPDFVTVLWQREGTPGVTRALRATPDGGVARLNLATFGDATIEAWESNGTGRFSRRFQMNYPSLAVSPTGDFIVAGDSLKLMRFNPLGEIVAERIVFVDRVNAIGSIELSADGRLFVVGGTSSTALNVTPNALQKEQRGGTCVAVGRIPSAYPCYSGWVARFHAGTFDLEALTYLGGADENYLYALALDRQGNVLVAGAARQRQVDREPYPRTSGAVSAASRPSTGLVMTVSRLSPDLDRILESTWLAGSDEASAQAVDTDESGRIIILGATTSPNFPATAGWTRVCGPRRVRSVNSWSFGLRLSPAFDRVDGSTQFGDAVAPNRIDFETRANCVFNGGSYDFGRELASGQIVTMIGGPFFEEDTVTLNGVPAPVLYRDEHQINFVIPREAGTGNLLPLELSGRLARTFDVIPARPTWIWHIFEEGALRSRGNFQINARRADASLNSDDNGFSTDEEIRAYATGVDLGKPLQLFRSFYDREIPDFTASYVPGTFDSVVEFRFRNRGLNGGVNVLGIVNDGVYSGSNPGYIWVAP